MRPVRLCFENKKNLSFSYTKEKITAIGLNSDFFHLILVIHCLFIFHYASKYNILAFFKRGCLSKNHPRRPVGSQSGREKRRDECFQVRVKEPLRTDSPRTISKNSSRCRLLIGHKNALYYCAQSVKRFLLSSFSWVRTRRLLSHHNCPVRSPSLCVQGKLLFST